MSINDDNKKILNNNNSEQKKETKTETINIINENKDSNINEEHFIYKNTKSGEIRKRNLSEEAKKKKSLHNYNDNENNGKKLKEKIKNLDNDKEYKQFKEDIDKGINFIDYFLIIGISPEIFFDDKIYECDLDELKTKYKDKIIPKIISYFPEFEKTTIAFDDSIIAHCFPNGYNIVKSNKMPKTEIFSFILDNNYFNLNYPRKYLSCLICYESINKYKLLYEEYKKLSNNIKNDDDNQKEEKKRNKSQKKNNQMQMTKSLSALDLQSNVSNDTTPSVGNERIYIPKCLMIMSLYPFFAEYEKILFKLYRYSMKIIKESYEINQNAGKTAIYNNLQRAMTLQTNTAKKTFSPQYINITVPIDKIIENLLIEFPAPPRGVFKVQYSLLTSEKYEISQSLMNELPLIEVNLKKVFITYDIPDIITIYLSLFLETRVLFFSKDIELLNIFIYGLLSLLFPFHYQFQIITILPKESFEILETISPFIAGINQSYKEDFFEKRDITLDEQFLYLIVDVDEERIEFIHKENEIPDFPKNHKKTLEKNLQQCLNTFMKKEIRQKNLEKKQKNKKTKTNKSSSNTNNSNNTSNINNTRNTNNTSNTNNISSINNTINEEKTTDTSLESKTNQIEFSLSISEDKIDSVINFEEEDDTIEIDTLQNNQFNNFNIDYEFNKKINEIFFNFNSYLLCNYSKYLNLDFYSQNETPSLEILFKVKEFLNEVPNSDKKFYNLFITETQLFQSFVFMRMIPKNSKEKIEVLTFDEKINQNFPNKLRHNIFLGSKEYDICNKYSVQKARKLTKEEKKFYKNIDNQKKLLSYGIIIEEDKGNLYFKYPIFPKLTTEFFFADNFKEYFVPNNLNENIDTINEDMISKSHLGGIKTKQDDMINYIYLAWMQMWAMTFWYCDEQEKKYWFQELLKIIDKTTSHDMEIYNLLFETLSINGKENMVLELYNILLKLHLNPSFKVHNIVMKILDKKKTKIDKNMNKHLLNNMKKESEQKYSNRNFRKRTFKSKYYGNILSDNIMIYAFDTCIKCQEKNINLETLSLNYKEMNRELMWAKCSYCGDYFLPKITIQYGTEINKSGKIKLNTSKNDCVVLFSPYFLKDNYHSLTRNFGIKLDVEELMLKYNVIFWNSVWYFKLYNLEYDFMLPYQQCLDKMIFDKKMTISTFELEKELQNNKIVYADEEDDLKYHSEDLKIQQQYSFIISK